MKFLAILAAFFLATGALAQPGNKHDKRRGMSQEERQTMREQTRDAYRDRQSRQDRPRHMTPQERDKLRRDIQDANQDLRKR
jgi:hypothetical protein